MNLLQAEAVQLVTAIQDGMGSVQDVDLYIFPPSLYVSQLNEKKGALSLGVQNFYPIQSGAFTGEISLPQLQSCGATSVLIGHSERRMLFGESPELLKQKVSAAIQHGVEVFFCCGEPLEIREADAQLEYVKKQLVESIFHLSKKEILSVVIAYEPIWAIGTGKTATCAQAGVMHAAIRTWISEHYDNEVAATIPILYGGSCNENNANELFSDSNIDGGLIGGASLNATSFLTIATSF